MDYSAFSVDELNALVATKAEQLKQLSLIGFISFEFSKALNREKKRLFKEKVQIQVEIHTRAIQSKS